MKIMKIDPSHPDFKSQAAHLEKDIRQLPSLSKEALNAKVKDIVGRELAFYKAHTASENKDVLTWMKSLASLVVLTKDGKNREKILKTLKPIFMSEMKGSTLAKANPEDVILDVYISLKCLVLAEKPEFADKLKALEKQTETAASLLQKIRDDSQLQEFIGKKGDIKLKKYFLLDQGELEVLETLAKIQNGIDAESLLHYISKSDLTLSSEELKEIIVKNGLDVNAKDVEGQTALQIARLAGNDMMAKALIENGAF